MPRPDDIRAALGELTAGARVKEVASATLPNGKLEVHIHLEVPRKNVAAYLAAMLERAEDRELIAAERHLDAMHEAAGVG